MTGGTITVGSSRTRSVRAASAPSSVRIFERDPLAPAQ
jgi:hypothetical protein